MSEHTSTHADLPPMSRADLAPRWVLAAAPRATPTTELAASVPPSASADAAPFVRHLVSTKRASSRDVEPYQACRAQVDQLLELQSEQVGLAQSLRAALRVAPMRARTAKRVMDNVENIAPDCHGCSGSSSSSSSRQQKPPSAGTEADSQPSPTPSSLPSLVSSVTSLVHRLHVLQRESAEFAATRCLPALAELFATFEAYWVWKRSSMCDGGVQEEEEASATLAAASSASTHRAMDGATTPSQAAQKRPSQQQRPPTLRQRYDQALRVRDELLSFLQLHAEAVRALDVQLEQWRQCRGSEPAAKPARGWLTVSPTGTSGVPVAVPHDADAQTRTQRCEFEAYICQLVEVSQATHHIAQLLQAALRALCRPSPRTSRPSLKLSADAVVEDEGLSSSSKAPRQAEANAAPSPGTDERRFVRLQARSSVNTGGLANSRTDAKRVSAYPSTEGSGRPSSSPAPNTSGTVGRPECVLRSLSTPKARTLRGCAKPTPCGDARSVSGTAGDAQCSWIDALSPLTPPPTAATASASPSASPSLRIEHSEPHQQLRRQRHGRRRLSPSPSPPGVAAQAEGSASPEAASHSSSLYAAQSTAGDVSLSPLTVQRGAAAVVPAHSREESADREPHCPVQMPSFSSRLGGPGDAEEDSDVQAAVTPVITMRLAATGSATRNLGDDVASRLSANAEHSPRSGRHSVSQDGARSLLRELASASANAAAGADEPLPTCPQPLVSRRRDVPDVPAFADSTRESSAEVTANAPGVTAVYVPPPSEQPSSCHDDASVTALTPVIVDVAKSGEGHAASQPFPPPPPPLQRASAMHTAAAATATRASVSRNTSMSLHLLSPRSLSIDDSASRRTTCNECGGAGEEGLSSAVRAASISTSLWPRLHHRAVSLSSSSAAPVLPSADVAGGAQVARNTTALVYTPSHALTNEPEGDGGAASTYSTSRTVDPNFYTARVSGAAGVSPPPALAATFHGSASSAGREPSPTPLEPTQYPEQQQQGRQARHAQEWVRTFSPTPLPLDSLERELDEVQQRLQVPAPPPHSSPALSASSAASDNHAAPWPQRRSLEDRAMLTMREELKALRAEQRHSLHKMRKYVKHTLEEVAEAVSALSSHNHSSRGSSCASSRSQRSGTAHEGNDNDADASAAGARVTVAAEKQRHASHASEQARADASAKSNEAASASAAIKLSGNSATPPSRLSTTQQQQTAPAVPASPPSKAAELQRSLAMAEAKSARLEQLAVQLKKRLWMAELSRLSPTSATPGAGELTATAKRHLSLRDAFVYGLSSDASDPEDYDGNRPKTGQASGGVGYSDEDGSAADGVAAEERAMLYLVDRELGYRTALDVRAHSQRRPSALRQTTSEAYSSSRLVPYDGSRSSSMEHERSPNMRCFEDDTATYHGLAVTSTGSAGIGGGHSGRRLCSSSAAPIGAISGTTATRSLGILQQRASIFQVLRQNQAAWDAQSSASTGQQQQQQSERSQLCPPPPLQHCSADTAAEVSGKLTASVPSRAHSSPPSATPQSRPHPYNADPASSRHGREANGGAAVGFPRQRVFPHYYTAISGGSDTGFVSGAELQASTSASALRAEQVLQNAKRLLQRRSASLAAGHHNISDNSHTSASLSGALQSSLTVASSPQTRSNAGDHRSEMPYHHGEGATGGVSAALVGRFSRPGQWGDCVEQLDGATPPPRAFAAPALHSGMTDAATALQRVSGSLDRGADSISAADSGHGPRSHPSSPESAYHGYDTSPCSAVAYSTSKIPRPSSPSAAKAAPKWTQQWCTPASTAAGPPLLADVSRATTSVGPPRHAQHRVDSATSPISRDGAEVRTTADRGERDAYIHSDGGLHHRELSARTVTTSIEGDYSPPSDRTTDTRSTCGFRSSFSPLDAAVEQHVHDSRQEVPVALTSRVGQSTSRRTSCSTSSTLSCGSAQQELLDTLENQESTLAAALNHLQEQQRQVREKHQQVSLLAKQAALVAPARAPLRTPRDDYQRAAGSAAAAAATARKQLTRTFSRDRRGNASAAGTSCASSDLRHLLERFAAAETSLAERERRVRKALRVVQRQRSALSRDDLL